MDPTKALGAYFRIRARQEHLAKLAGRRGTTSETLSETEVNQLRLAERELNSLRGVATLELLITHRSSVLAYMNQLGK